MLRASALYIALFLCQPALAGLDIEAFRYRDPVALSVGGTTVFGSQGIHTLHSNPAAFSVDEKVDYTLLAVAPWLTLAPGYYPPSGGISDSSLAEAGGSDYGVGMSAMMGLTGKGVGLGILTGAETFVGGAGRPESSLSGYLDSELSLVVGYAAEFELGPVRAALGGDIRPLLRIIAPLTQEESLDVGRNLTSPGALVRLLNRVENPYYGAGVGFDLGGTVHLGGFSAGVVVRDVGNTVLSATRPQDVETAFNEMFRAAITTLDDQNSENITIPMAVNLGLTYVPSKPVFEYLEPVVYAEIKDMANLESGSSFVKSGLLGLALGLPGPLSVRSGINAGGFNLGLGLELPIVRLEVAYYRLPATLGEKEASHGLMLEGRIEF